jgi:nicotinamidase/pyrazinamidase
MKEVESWTEETNWLDKKADFSVEELKAYLSTKENQMDAVWPEHCVENTFWSEFYKEFDSSKVDVEIKKWFEGNTHPYSAFGGKTLDETKSTLDIIKDYWVKLVKVVGLATDYCNIATAMDAKKYGFSVEFIKKATAWVDPAGTIEALNKMREKWIKIID